MSNDNNPASGFAENFDVYVQKVTVALSTSAKVAAADYDALAQMNQSALVFYKNVGERLASVSRETDAVEQRTSQVMPSSDKINAIRERTHRLEALVNALNNYTERLESELDSSELLQ